MYFPSLFSHIIDIFLKSLNVFTLVSNQAGCHGSLRVLRRIFLKFACEKSCFTYCFRRKLREINQKRTRKEYFIVKIPKQSILIKGVEEKYLFVTFSVIFSSRNILERKKRGVNFPPSKINLLWEGEKLLVFYFCWFIYAFEILILNWLSYSLQLCWDIFTIDNILFFWFNFFLQVIKI